MKHDKYHVAETRKQETVLLQAFAEPSAEEVQQLRERRISQLRLIWHSRPRLGRVLLWSLAISTLMTLLMRDRYEAVTRLMPPEGQTGSALAMLSALMNKGTTGGQVAGIAGDLLGAKSSGGLFVGVLGSQTVKDRLIAEFDLRRVYGDSKIEDARDSLAKHTDVSEERKSGIITIRVTDHDPKRAAAMATAYVKQLDVLVAQVSTSSARRERIFLESRLQSVKQDLDAAARKFSDFASKNTAIDVPAQGRAMVEAAARLQGELIAAESILRGLETIYTEENVRVRSMRAKVNELREQLGKLGGDADASAGLQPKEAEPMYPSIRRLPILGVTYADLYRQTKIQEAVFELLTQQYELAKVQEAKEIPSVKVLDAAVIPTKKIFPPRFLLVAVLTLACLILSCFWVVGEESWERTSPQDSGKQFLQEIAGTLHSEAIRIAPDGSFLRRIISRNGLRPPVGPEVETAADSKDAANESPAVARAARNTSAD